MSTNRRENQSFPRIFKGLQERTRHHKKCGALRTIKPYLLAFRFHGVRSLTRKENSCQGFYGSLRVQLRYRKSGPKGPEYQHSSSRILTQFPFDKWPMIGHFEREFPCPLESSNLSNWCSHRTFLHFGLQSCHLNICYYHQDLHQRPFHPGSRQRLHHDPYAVLFVRALLFTLTAECSHDA